jgi:hypothetical protein
LGQWHKTTVKMVVDMVTDSTEPDQKTVKTREAEVRDMQLKGVLQLCHPRGQEMRCRGSSSTST